MRKWEVLFILPNKVLQSCRASALAFTNQLALMPAQEALPGPMALFLVGAALQFDPSAPHQTLLDLAQEYGPIMQVRIAADVGK